MNRGLACALAAALALAACKRQDMYTQRKYQTWDRNPYAPRESNERPPVPGTVALERPGHDEPQPATADLAMLQRGQQRYTIFCTPCHGASGDGWGMVVQRGYPHPPDLAETRLRTASAQSFYDTITRGHGLMYPYAAMIPPADRWAIVAYVRALQLSRAAPVAELAEPDRQALAAAGAAAR